MVKRTFLYTQTVIDDDRTCGTDKGILCDFLLAQRDKILSICQQLNVLSVGIGDEYDGIFPEDRFVTVLWS